MKKLLLSSLFILTMGFFATELFAQQGAYVNVYGSYGLAGSSVNNFQNTIVVGSGADAEITEFLPWLDYDANTTYDADLNAITQETSNLVSLNLGKGLNFGASFGYMFNDYLGAELGLNYLLSGKTSNMYKSTDSFDPNAPVVISYEGEISASQFRINPMIVVSTDFMDFVPYAKFGVMVGIGTKINETYTDKTTPDVTIVQKFESDGGIALGVNAVFGALYKLNKKTGIFLELSSTSMSYSPKTRTITDYTTTIVNGTSTSEVNELIDEAFPYSAKVTEYTDEITEYSTGSVDPTLSTLAMKIKYPFSTFGFNLGVRFSF